MRVVSAVVSAASFVPIVACAPTPADATFTTLMPDIDVEDIGVGCSG